MSDTVWTSGTLGRFDTDLLSLTVQAGERYVIQLSGTLLTAENPGSAGLWVLMDNDEWRSGLWGTAEQVGDGVQLVFTAPHDGTAALYLHHESWLPSSAWDRQTLASDDALRDHNHAVPSQDVLAYTLSVAPAEADDHPDLIGHGTRVDVGSSLVASTEHMGDRDVFSVYLQRGERLLVSATNVRDHLGTASISAFNADGVCQPMRSYSVADDSQYLLADEAGWYDLELVPFLLEADLAEGPVAYRLELASLGLDDHANRREGATPLAPGDTLVATLDLADDSDWIQLQTEPGRRYELQLLDDQGQPSPNVDLDAWPSSLIQEAPGVWSFVADTESSFEVALARSDVGWFWNDGAGTVEVAQARISLEALPDLPAVGVSSFTVGAMGLGIPGAADADDDPWPLVPQRVAGIGDHVELRLSGWDETEVQLTLAAGDRVQYAVAAAQSVAVWVGLPDNPSGEWPTGTYLEHDPMASDAVEGEASTAWFEAPVAGVYVFHVYAYGAWQATDDPSVHLNFAAQPRDDHGDTRASAGRLALDEVVHAQVAANDRDVLWVDLQAGHRYAMTLALDDGPVAHAWIERDGALWGFSAHDGYGLEHGVLVPSCDGPHAVVFQGEGQLRFVISEVPADDIGDHWNLATPLEGWGYPPAIVDDLPLMGLPVTAPPMGFVSVEVVPGV